MLVLCGNKNLYVYCLRDPYFGGYSILTYRTIY